MECPKDYYRTGSCSSFNDGYTCKRCNCPAGQYAKGCSGTSKGTCTACSNKSCPSGQIRSGVCTGATNGYVCSGVYAVFTRWGNRNCPKSTTKLYDGFIG